MHGSPPSVIYQAARLGDAAGMRQDFALARALEREGAQIGRLYGNAGGVLVALAHGLQRSALAAPARFGPQAASALDDFEAYFGTAQLGDLRRPRLRGVLRAPFTLAPLVRWLRARLREYLGADAEAFTLGALALPVYLCAQDKDGHPVLFGPTDPGLGATYDSGAVRIEDAPLVDAAAAALSEVLWLEPALVHGRHYKAGRPTFADISGLVLDLEARDPRPLQRHRPRTPLPPWPANAVTQAFIMHRWHERNQAALTERYADLVARDRALRAAEEALAARRAGSGLAARGQASEEWAATDAAAPQLCHVRLPYVGSTRVDVNMRDSIANRQQLQRRFTELGAAQLAGFPLTAPFTLVYGAGGFSGIVAGLSMARLIDAQGGVPARLFGVSSGVFNGFFHAAALAARRAPGHWAPEAMLALDDLVAFFDSLAGLKLLRINRRPATLYRGLVNLDPLRAHLRGFLQRWSGRDDVDRVTFSSLGLPLYVEAARASDGFPEIFGAPDGLCMRHGGRAVGPVDAPVLDAVMAGLAQPFYVAPVRIGDELYLDGGAASYDVDLYAAAMEPVLQNMVSVHVADPEGHSYGLAERPRALEIAFDIHNLTFPEQRRRMSALCDLLYAHEARRQRLRARLDALRAQGQAQHLAELELDPQLLEDGWWRRWEPRPGEEVLSG